LDNKKIIDGSKISKQILAEIKEEMNKTGLKPGLALILVGNDPGSEVYVNMKAKRCAEMRYYSVIERLPESTSENELLSKISGFNKDERIHGILVQSPFPKHINEMKVFEAIDHRKDVDGFNPVNAGRLIIGEKCFVPCTPLGIIELLKRYNIGTDGKNAVVIGRSNLVGKPIANLLIQKNRFANATVTLCHSRTADLSGYTKNADIIIAAIGRAKFLKGEMIKEGCIIIDVGINKIDDSSLPKGYRLVGDVDFDDCYAKASMITPVPGGVGPMTIAMLLKNTFDSAAKNIYP
jgi:methylenetetrahydrofolate dehydrogenase (NADP+)/methenyltetrahydrofolate cyclohydrolase